MPQESLAQARIVIREESTGKILESRCISSRLVTLLLVLSLEVVARRGELARTLFGDLCLVTLGTIVRDNCNLEKTL